MRARWLQSSQTRSYHKEDSALGFIAPSLKPRVEFSATYRQIASLGRAWRGQGLFVMALRTNLREFSF
jgi:hypothetical protein